MEALNEWLFSVTPVVVAVITHEYVLALYGVLLWQIEQLLTLKDATIKKTFRNIGSSLIWVGLLVVFDDEILSQYNAIAHLDYSSPPFWMYVIMGFSVDIIRSHYSKEKK